MPFRWNVGCSAANGNHTVEWHVSRLLNFRAPVVWLRAPKKTRPPENADGRVFDFAIKRWSTLDQLNNPVPVGSDRLLNNGS